MTRNAVPLLSREARLLLQADGSDRPTEEFRELLRGPLDWRRLLTLADVERAALPLWRSLRAAGFESDRTEVKVLRRMAGIWEFKLLHLERLLHETLELFRSAGMDVILLKGAGAALTVYERFDGRPMGDVDLLVDPERAEEAWTLAQGAGWRWDAARFPKESYGEAHHLPPLHDAFGSGSGLEVHRTLWMPDHPFRFSEADVRREAVRHEVAGRTFMAPRREHQLLHCCIHFAWSHRIRGHAWRAFHDVRSFVSAGIDWPVFLRLAMESRADTSCYWTLRMSANALGLELPPEALAKLRPSGPDLLLDRLERHFMMNILPDEVTCPSLAFEKRLWRLAIRRGKGSHGIELPADHAPVGLQERMTRHLTQMGAWFRYLVKLA